MNAQNLNLNINGGCAALAIATENSISNLREGNYSAFFQEYLDSSLGDRGEKTKEIRKLFAAAAVKAASQGVLPYALDNPQEVGVLVHEGLARIKSAYQYGVGLITDTEMREHLIDNAFARAHSITINAINKAEEFALENTGVVVDMVVDRAATAISTGLAAIYPPATALAPFIQAGAQKIKPAIRQFVNTGIKAIADVSRNFVNATMPKLKESVKALGKKISNYLLQ